MTRKSLKRDASQKDANVPAIRPTSPFSPPHVDTRFCQSAGGLDASSSETTLAEDAPFPVPSKKLGSSALSYSEKVPHAGTSGIPISERQPLSPTLRHDSMQDVEMAKPPLPTGDKEANPWNPDPTGMVVEDEKDAETYYPDGGWEAWRTVMGAWILTASFMGMGFTWGIYVTYYQDFTYRNTSPTVLQFAAGVFCFVQNGSAFIAGRLGERFGYKRMIAIGGISMVCFMVISAFTYTHLVGMYITQAIGIGFSNGLAMPLCMAIPSQWFSKHRGLANGIAISGSGTGGAISTTITRLLLTNLGPRKTLLITAGIQVVSLTTGWMLIRVRDVPENRLPKYWLPRGIWRKVSWYSLAGAVFVGVFGYLPPYYFITQYTQEKVPNLDSTSYLAALPLTMMTLCTGIGRLIAGLMADRIGPINVLLLSFLMGAIAQMAVWPFCQTFGGIIAFSVINGFFSSMFMGLLATACSRLFGGSGLATLTGFMIVMNSPGQLLGSTISSAVLTSSGHRWISIYLSSGGFMLLGFLALLPARIQGDRRIFAKF